MMTSRERLMLALCREKPDRLPVTVHQWQQFHLDNFMNGQSDLEAMVGLGMDAAVQYMQPSGQYWLQPSEFPQFSTANWRDTAAVVSDDPDHRVVRHTIETPGGMLTYATEADRATVWISEHLIKHDEDIGLIRKFMPVYDLDPAPVEELYDRVGDLGIVRGFVWGDQAGCWQHACCLMSPTELIMKTFDDPAWVHELLGILMEKKLRFIESMAGARFDLVETGGGSSSTTLISPKIHREFCLPYDRKMHDALHGLGFKTTYHTCGGTRGIEEMIVENGTDASETLAAPSIGGNCEPWEYAEKIAGRIALIGGMDQINLLTDGTEQQIRDQVRRLFETVGRDGGYILSASDHFFDAPPENLRVYAEAARECVYPRTQAT